MKKREYLELEVDDYKKALKESICHIIFEKNDGTLRQMIGTLRPELLPKKEIVEVKKRERKEPKTSVAVFDLRKEEWRSFRIDRVLKFQRKLTPRKN